MTAKVRRRPHVKPKVLQEGVAKTLSVMKQLIGCYEHDHPATQEGDDPILDHFFAAYAHWLAAATELEEATRGSSAHRL
jgi:hypothetical protein